MFCFKITDYLFIHETTPYCDIVSVLFSFKQIRELLALDLDLDIDKRKAESFKLWKLRKKQLQSKEGDQS